MKPARRFTRAAAALGRSFDEASDGGRWPQWAGMPAPARHQFAARHQLASRSAYLVANSPSASSIANVWVTSLCGDGPSIRSGHPNAATRRALEDAWSRYHV